MSTALLRTKFYMPPVRPNLVSRPRLVARLNEGLDLGRRLTLISAPAGFGKSTLLGEWAAQTARRVAWVSLDGADNDPSRFWAYAITALHSICPSVSDAHVAALLSPHPPVLQDLLSDLINEVAGAESDSGVLVLDDYHLIEAPAVHDSMTFLLDHLPDSLHVTIGTRADPPMPLARLRGRGLATELRAADLRFTLEEAAAFLNDVMGLDLSAEQIATLDARAEGWIAGLQMAALSMQGRNDASSFIQTFSGSHRFVLDYLVEEVLDRQPRAMEAFLLKTSILDRMTASLCNAITGQNDGQERLNELERANLFVTRLDDERRWYRYHHLFAELLRKRLEQTGTEQVAVLHATASEWHVENGLIVEAVSHALAAGDVQRAGRLVAENALALMDRGELGTLVCWLDALPVEALPEQLEVFVAVAWALAYTGRLGAAEERLEKAAQVLREASDAAPRHRLMGHMAAIRAYSTFMAGDFPAAETLARQALADLPEEDPLPRAIALRILGLASYYGGDVVAATEALLGAVAVSRRAGDSHVLVMTLADLAANQAARGQLRQAAETCHEALAIAETHLRQSGVQLPAAGYVHMGLSTIFREWNDLLAAERHIRAAVALCEHWGMAEPLADSYFHLALTLDAMGANEEALEVLQTARQLSTRLSCWYGDAVECYEVIMRLGHGDTAFGSRWLESKLHFDAGYEMDTPTRLMVSTAGRVLLAENRPDEALALLAQAQSDRKAGGVIGRDIDLQALRALAFEMQGETEQALSALKNALALAGTEGYVRTFVSLGQPMGTLLRKAIAAGIAVNYASRLLEALDCEGATQASRPEQSSLVEPLSAREMEVLRLLTSHLSSTEIAETLFVSPNTVRSHIKNIYGKLGVHSRSGAVAQARELGLL